MQHRFPATVDVELASGTLVQEVLSEAVAHNTATVDQVPLIAPLDASPATVPAAHLPLYLPRLLQQSLCLRMDPAVALRVTLV